MFDLCLSWNVFEPFYNVLVEFNRNIESKISDEFVNMKFYDFLCSYASGLWERLNVGEDFPTYQPWRILRKSLVQVSPKTWKPQSLQFSLI